MPGWYREGNEIVHDRHLGNFATAIAFVNLVADASEVAGHHPDILVHGWNRVQLRLTTHSIGALTTADFELASRLDRLP